MEVREGKVMLLFPPLKVCRSIMTLFYDFMTYYSRVMFLTVLVTTIVSLIIVILCFSFSCFVHA